MGKMLKQCIKGIMLSMMSIATLITPSFNLNANAVRITNIGARVKSISALDHVTGSTIKGLGSNANVEYQNTNSDSFLSRNGLGNKWTCLPGAPLGTHEGGNEVNLQYLQYFPNGYNYKNNDDEKYGGTNSGNNFPIGNNNNYFKDCVVLKSCRFAKANDFTLPMNGYFCFNTSTEKFFVIAAIPAKWESHSYKNRGDLGSYGSDSYDFQIKSLKVYNQGSEIKTTNYIKNGNDIFVTAGGKNNIKFHVIYSNEFDLSEVNNLSSKVTVTAKNVSYTAEAKFNVTSDDIKGLKEGTLICCNFEDYFNRPISVIADKVNRIVTIECPQRMNITKYDYKFLIEAAQIHLHNSVTDTWTKLDATNAWESVDANGQCHVDFTNIDLGNIDKVQADVYLTWEYYGKDKKKSWWSGETQNGGSKVVYKYIIASDLNFEEEEEEEEEELDYLVKTLDGVATYSYSSGKKKVVPKVKVEYDEEEGTVNVTVSHPTTKELEDKNETTYEYKLEKIEVLKGSKVVGSSTDLLGDVDEDEDEDEDEDVDEDVDEEEEDDVEYEAMQVSDLEFKSTDSISVRVYTSYEKTATKKGEEITTPSKKSSTFKYSFTEKDENGKKVNTRYAKKSTVLKKTKISEIFKASKK